MSNVSRQNLLPRDGTVYYFDGAIREEKAEHFFHQLVKAVEWKNDVVRMFGRTIVTKRKVAWYGDRNFEYTYSKETKRALPWNSVLQELKECTQEFTGREYNSCLLNYYESGESGMGWHSDNEPELKKRGSIASVSLGAERKFALKHNDTSEKVSVVLQSGSILLMEGETQEKWKHSLPKSKRVHEARVNLTFRTIEG